VNELEVKYTTRRPILHLDVKTFTTYSKI